MFSASLIHLSVIFLSLECFALVHYKEIVIDKTIYYTVDKSFTQQEKDYIKASVRHVTSRSCLTPKIHNIHYQHIPAWIEFVRADEPESCSTTLRPFNATTIVLSPHCFDGGWVVHEVLHALGFDHEHQRRDRDCYVEVHSSKWDDPGYSIINDMDIRIPYDVHSVMHYGRGSFLRPEKDYPDQNVVFGSKNVMSQKDTATLNHEFCGEPHYCERNQRECEEVNASIQSRGCVRSLT